MSKWKPGDLPTSIDQYGYHHAIWTDKDLIKWMLIAFFTGIIIGVIL